MCFPLPQDLRLQRQFRPTNLNFCSSHSSSTLPCIAHSSCCRTCCRNSISMVRISLPSCSSVRSNIDIFVLNHGPCRKTDTTMPKMVRGSVFISGKSNGTGGIPASKGSHASCNLNCLTSDCGHDLVKCDSYCGSSSAACGCARS